MLLWSIDIWQRRGRAYSWAKIVSLINGFGKTGQAYAKQQKKTTNLSIHKSKCKMDKRFINISCETIKILEKAQAAKSQISHILIFLPIYPLGLNKQRKKETYGTTSN